MKSRNKILGIAVLLLVTSSQSIFASSYYNEKHVTSQYLNIYKTKNTVFDEKDIISQYFDINKTKNFYYDENNVISSYFDIYKTVEVDLNVEDMISGSFHIDTLKDEIAPKITIDGIPVDFTNKDIILKIMIIEEDVGSGIKKLILPDGTEITPKEEEFFTMEHELLVSENGSYTFKTEDNAGNISEEVIVIEKIDKEKPMTPKLERVDNQLVLTKSTDNMSGIKEHLYQLNGGEWISFNGDIDISSFDFKEHNIKVKAIDNATNESDVFNLIFEVVNQGLIDATEAVIKAESTKKQEDVDSARDLVNKLPDSQEKTDLNNRLDAIQKEIDDKKELDDRIKELEDRIENMTDKSEAPDIQKEIDKLPDGDEKDKLQDLLDKKVDELTKKEDADSALKEATDAVIKAETSKKQEDIDSARDLVNQLPDSTSKTDLNERLDAIQKEIDDQKELEDKIKELEDRIENMIDKSEAEDIQKEIDKLPIGPEKDKVQDALDKKVEELDNIDSVAPKISITGITTHWSNQDTILDLLVTEDKSGLKEIHLPNDKKVTISEDKKMEMKLTHTIVKNGEYTFKAIDNQGNIGTEKIIIENIDKVAPTIPEIIYENREFNFTPAEDDLSGVDKHLYRVSANDNELKDAEWLEFNGTVDLPVAKVNPMQRMSFMSIKTQGTEFFMEMKAVDKAGNESDIFKTSFNFINEALQDATQAVVKAEGSKKQEDIDSARDLVNQLPDGQDKTDLNDRLDAIQKEVDDQKELEDVLKNATDAVVQAETSKKQEDIDSARDLVNQLPDGQDKTDLNDRLDAIQKEVDDKKELDDKIKELEDRIENMKDKSESEDIQKEIDKLPDGEDKDKLQDALDKKVDELTKKEEAENNLQAAIDAVEKAEKTITQEDVDSARTLVNKLPKGQDRTELNNRLDLVQKEIDRRKALEEATKLVVKAESTVDRADINKAYTSVNRLPNSTEKTDLLNRLEALEKQLAEKLAQDKAEKEALQTVVLAESLKREPYIQNAKDKVNALKQSEIKSELEERLNNLEKLLNADSPAKIKVAQNLVAAAETLRRDPHITKATTTVNELQPSEEKSELLLRLDILKNGKLTKISMDNKKAILQTTMLVEEAEKYQYKTIVSRAKTKVSKLPSGTDKTTLTNRLNKIK